MKSNKILIAQINVLEGLKYLILLKPEAIKAKS